MVLTTEILGRAIDLRELAVDNLLGMRNHGVAEGVCRIDYGIQDLVPVRGPPAKVRISVALLP